MACIATICARHWRGSADADQSSGDRSASKPAPRIDMPVPVASGAEMAPAASTRERACGQPLRSANWSRGCRPASRRIDLSLERMHRLLRTLDHPAQLPPVIHVAHQRQGFDDCVFAGDSGSAGLRVHAYTSPICADQECIASPNGVRQSCADTNCGHVRACERVNPASRYPFESKPRPHLLFGSIPHAVLLEVGLAAARRHQCDEAPLPA